MCSITLIAFVCFLAVHPSKLAFKSEVPFMVVVPLFSDLCSSITEESHQSKSPR